MLGLWLGTWMIFGAGVAALFVGVVIGRPWDHRLFDWPLIAAGVALLGLSGAMLWRLA